MSGSQLAIAQTYTVRSLHMAAIQYPYIVLTLPQIIAISLHTYVSRTIRLEPALTYLSSMSNLYHIGTVKYPLNFVYIILVQHVNYSATT